MCVQLQYCTTPCFEINFFYTALGVTHCLWWIYEKKDIYEDLDIPYKSSRDDVLMHSLRSSNHKVAVKKDVTRKDQYCILVLVL